MIGAGAWAPPRETMRAVSRINFSEPYRSGRESAYLQQVIDSQVWHGDGPFTDAASRWLERFTGARHSLLTTSGTHALELASILLDLGPGDEVVCPAFTFTSTATAIAIRGATPVFVDVLPETMNIDPQAVAAAITDRTRAISVVHYAGVAVDLPAILDIAQRHDLAVIEDNAHGFDAYLDDRHLGTWGTFGVQSWHDTKNVTAGEGGSLLVNDDALAERAEIVREKGTNRSLFLRGAVDKYTWVDHGSSFLPSELNAALLLAQLEASADTQARRQAVWSRYDTGLRAWAGEHGIEQMHVPEGRRHPAHMSYLVLPTHEDQLGLITHLRELDIVATFHYQPLDTAAAGRRLGRTPHPCPVTADRSQRLVRLPLHAGLSDPDVDRVLEAVTSYRPGTSGTGANGIGANGTGANGIGER